MEKRALLKYAYDCTEFYKEKYAGIDLDGDWGNIPVASKGEIAHGGISVISSKYFSRLGGPGMITDVTSGSTGECLEVHIAEAEQKKSLLSLWLYRKKYYGIDTRSRLCYFYTFRDGRGEAFFEYRKNGLGFSKSRLREEHLEEICNQMYDFEPEWLLLQPGVAMVLARYLFENGLEPIPGVRYIELTGEMFSEEQRKFISRAFDAPVASQYGCNEVGTIAYECPFGHLHVMEHNVYVEVVREGSVAGEGEYGNILVTAKNQLAMPFIRYDTGDVGRICQVACQCGKSGSVLELSGTRKNDMVTLEGGEMVCASLFCRVFQAIARRIDGRIFQYRVEQLGINEFVVSIATDEREEEMETLFRDFIRETELKDATFRFAFARYLLPEERTGKFQFFTNHVAHSIYG